jgi:hypothetical protein
MVNFKDFFQIRGHAGGSSRPGSALPRNHIFVKAPCTLPHYGPEVQTQLTILVILATVMFDKKISKRT